MGCRIVDGILVIRLVTEYRSQVKQHSCLIFWSLQTSPGHFRQAVYTVPARLCRLDAGLLKDVHILIPDSPENRYRLRSADEG